MLDGDGLPVLIEVSGNDYLKNAVDERFTRKGSRSVWRSSSEADSSTAPGFYTSVDGAPEETALLARALLKAPGGRLGVLPGGEARIEKVGDLTLPGPPDSAVVSQYAIHGLGLSPTPIWLDRDGRFFAQGFGAFFIVIRQGFEAAAPALLKAQDEYAARRGADLATRLARHPTGAVVFRDANLFDPVSGRSRPTRPSWCRVTTSLRSAPTTRVAIPAGAEVVNLHGRALLPGLWDMHVHIGDRRGSSTSPRASPRSRDMGNDIDELLRRRRRFDAGQLHRAAPIIMAGLIDGPGPYAGPTKVVADDSGRARGRWSTDTPSSATSRSRSTARSSRSWSPFLAAEAHERGCASAATSRRS